MDPFEDIRPYRDDEVRPVLDRLLKNDELVAAMTRLRFPRAAHRYGPLLTPLVRLGLRRQVAPVRDVHGMQLVVEQYMADVIGRTSAGFTVSGVERLPPRQPCLFISNHRDIAMDPAFVNYALYHGGHDTARIAIGDNLLTKDYAADLMRLNKSFIVKRSAKGPRQMLAAYRQLSGYVRNSIVQDRVPVWIAQREGRAKDGYDETEVAIVKMLAMSQDKASESFADFIRSLRIVPVAISYEYDPLDQSKARELETIARTGRYDKGEQEDVRSIALGIAGRKGAVHVAFGVPIDDCCDTPGQVAEQIDRQVIANYVLHPSNCFAYHALFGAYPQVPCGAGQHPFQAAQHPRQEAAFKLRLAAMPAELRPYVLKMYANCIIRKQELGLVPGP